jgi:hypothetical protein
MATAAGTKIEFPDGLDDNDEPRTREQYAVLITSPVRLDQLDAEITHAMGWRKQAGLSADGDAEQASPENPARLYVERHEETDDETFLQAVANHTPDSAWVHQDMEEPPSFETAKEKVLGNGRITMNDLRAVLRGLLTG